MQHPNILELSQSALLIIDMQEAFRASIKHFDKFVQRIVITVQAAKILNLPILVTEQYPKGLGHTVPEIASELPATAEVLEKTSFSSCGAPTFASRLQELDTRQVIVAGIEAHICVNQTVHDLLATGYQVQLLTDCITSRNKNDRKVGLQKMQASGAIPATVEMALFELLRDAKHEQFKAIQGLIK